MCWIERAKCEYHARHTDSERGNCSADIRVVKPCMHDIGLKCEKLSRKIGGVGAKRERNRAQTMAELRVVANLT